jgi:hypothetical protein
MQELNVSTEFIGTQSEMGITYGQLMLGIGNEMNKLITTGDAHVLHEFIQSLIFIMETVQNRIKEEYGSQETFYSDKGWSC